MATLIVTTLLDDSTADAADLTLREAVDQAVSGDTITFDASLSGGTVALTDGQILIDKEITIDGDITGADEKADITIDGSGDFGDRLFEVEDNQTLTLASLTLSNGNSSGNGGAVLVNGGANLTVDHSTFSDNDAALNGGAIFGDLAGVIIINTSTFVGNEAGGNGGAIFSNFGQALVVNNSTFASNAVNIASFDDGGGALYLQGTRTDLLNTTITDNEATSGAGIWNNQNGSDLRMINTIVSGNDGIGSEIGGEFPSASRSIIDGDPTLIFASVTPIIGGGVLADNGGPVQTVALRDDPSNPALDVGASTLATDARGEARFDVPGVDNDPGGSDFADAGAFELQCFAAGTLITTATGETPVEALQIGDKVLTEDGRACPVFWIGRQSVLTRLASDRLEPVRIRKGALGGGLPHHDLIVTADHGMVRDGLIINASALVNGDSIDFVPLSELPARMTYYHVELEAHEVILANGAPSESFVDVATRKGFENYDKYLAQYGAERLIPTMPLPRVSARRLLPPTLRHALST